MRARLLAVAVLVAAAWATTTWVLAPVTVRSSSMTPSYCEGDVVVVLKPPWASDPQAGAVVTLEVPGQEADRLKRVVALGGQTVRIDDGRLVVDGRVVAEPYVDRGTTTGTFTRTYSVPTGAVFVLGDSRDVSVDSRDFGSVPASSLTGTVVASVRRPCPG